ncbi:MAG: S8 family serine peptidase [Candidatus Lokiarchaeota archaeon]|nr:S8 family serine peptidase [Candidatus Lokiarchaeota archaeon]MBD3202165.1 S8 family serine peptidase [Candidatus Lokiarchaeota archaeon]
MKIYPPFLKKIKEGINIDKDKFNNSQFSNHSEYNIIITFKNTNERDKFLSKYNDLRISAQFSRIPSIVTNLSRKEILNLKNEEIVLQIEEDQEVFLSYLDAIESLRLPEYQRNQIVYTGKGVNIGILDIGIQGNFNSNSKRFQEKPYSVKKLKDFSKAIQNVNITHGTLLANIIKSNFIDEEGFSNALAPDSNLIDLTISTKQKSYHISDLLKVLDLIDKENPQLDILLMAFSTSEASDGKDILSKMCNLLTEKNNLIIVAPAGNTGPQESSIGSPGAAENVITFGALDKNLSVASFTSQGPTLDNRTKPDFYLLGSKLIVPITESIQIKSSGTSLSAALGAGIIALLKEYNQELNVDEIKRILSKYSSFLNEDVRTLKISEIFEGLGLFHEPIFSLRYLYRRSLWVSIQIIIILILLFNWKLIYNLIKLLYGF